MQPKALQDPVTQAEICSNLLVFKGTQNALPLALHAADARSSLAGDHCMERTALARQWSCDFRLRAGPTGRRGWWAGVPGLRPHARTSSSTPATKPCRRGPRPGLFSLHPYGVALHAAALVGGRVRVDLSRVPKCEASPPHGRRPVPSPQNPWIAFWGPRVRGCPGTRGTQFWWLDLYSLDLSCPVFGTMARKLLSA